MQTATQQLRAQTTTLQGLRTTDRLSILLEAHPTIVIPPQMAKPTVNPMLHLPIQLTVPLQAQALCPEPIPVIRPLAIVKEHQAARMMALALVLVPKAQVPVLGTMPEAHPLVPIKKHQDNLHLSLLLYQWSRIQPRRPLLEILECLVIQVLQNEPVRIAKMTLLPRLALVLQGTLPLNHRLETKATQ